MAKYKRTIAVFSAENKYLRHCSRQDAYQLVKDNRATFVGIDTIKMVSIEELKKRRQRQKMKYGIIENEHRICYICNHRISDSETPTIDHVVPLSRDKYADVPMNMRCCHKKCNELKSNMLLSEFVLYVKNHRKKFHNISDRHLIKLELFAIEYEENYFQGRNVHKKKEKGGRNFGQYKH